MLDLNAQFKSLLANGKQAEVETLLPKAGELQKQMIDCSKKTLSGEIDKEALKEALKGNCDLPERLITTLMNEI